ncbi:HCLS1-binding protein 3 [Pipistrellus kuhlii]|uniref:HCLS1-binding protein 3 n=1 Tax=Pipistrellus kuhlii TaxID=59472 RepID=A0A7J7VUL0_PIPKU|nr:HCLS1-binding protein 3 [Pipistrellus kuhlii]KAF6328832.1 HCLS1 binding protein 3 [Pipistrellus kuhlii]
MQRPPALVTSRRVQNAHTGLDLAVPQHQEVRGRMMSGHVEYQILVVTRLAAFKSPKHKPEDVVQFLVSKKYSEIEELCQKLSRRYPAASLPPLPRKVLFVGESDIRERRAVFHEILRCVSQDTELAGSPELLEFLGTSSAGAAEPGGRGVSARGTGGPAADEGETPDFFQQQEGAEGPPSPGREEDTGKSSEEEEEALDPLGIMRSKKPKARPQAAAKPRPSPRLTLFDEEAGPSGTRSAGGSAEHAPARDPLTLFDDPDLGGAVPLGDPLLLPAAPASGEASVELFRLEEDLDQILNLGAEPEPRPPPKPKPAVGAAKPAAPPRAGPSEAAAGPPPPPPPPIHAMDEMDILQYIRDHDAPSQAAPSLF